MVAKIIKTLNKIVAYYLLKTILYIVYSKQKHILILVLGETQSKINW